MTSRCRPEAEQRHFRIGEVARACGVHPQTLRLYERAGLVEPARSIGNTRLYSRDDLERLTTILDLTREVGVNLAGVEMVLRLRARIAELERELDRHVRSCRGGPEAVARVRRHG